MKQSKPTRSPLALRSIEGHLAFTADTAWAWFRLPTQRWAFRADGERLNLIVDTAHRVAALSGRRLHLRVTSRPYPAESWAQGLATNTPDPMPGYAEHLATVSAHVSRSTMAVKEVYLGVEIGDRPKLATAVTDRVLRRPTRGEVAKVAKDARIVAETIAQAGLDGEPATDVEMEWLVRRSLTVGLPAPGALSPVVDGQWATEDLFELADGVEHDAKPFGDSVHVRQRGGGPDAYVSVLTVGRVDEIEIPDAAHNPWLTETDSLPFPVEWSIRLDVLDGDTAKGDIQKKLLVTRDMQKHHHEHGLDEPLALARQAEQARQVEDQMATGSEVEATRVHGWYRLVVYGATEDECLERARVVIDRYRKRQVTVVLAKGQHGMLREFIPGEPLSSTGYRRRLPVLYFAGGVPAAASSLGDQRGPYIGHTVGASRRAVMFDPHFATEIRETSGLVPIVGGLGAGKSILAALIVYEAARRGETAVMLDPSGPLAALTLLPELADRSRCIDLTSAPAGTLNPYAVVAEPHRRDHASDDEWEEAKVLAAQDRKQLALDVATMLLPPTLAASARTGILLGEAIRATKGRPATSLWTVVEHLEGGDSDAHDIAAYLRDMAEMPLSKLFFPTGPGVEAVKDDATLTVLTMPGLVLPPQNVAREHWSTQERMAVPLLHLASWYATRTIYGRPRHERKTIATDETHFMGEWAAGRALFNRLGRDSRKWNTCVLAASQNPKDILGMEVSNFISAAFVGRIQDEQVASEALRMLGVQPGIGYESVLAGLSKPSASGSRSGVREFVMRDVDGRVDKMRVDLDHLPHVLAALDTTAAPKPERERVVVASGRVEAELAPVTHLPGRRAATGLINGFPGHDLKAAQ